MAIRAVISYQVLTAEVSVVDDSVEYAVSFNYELINAATHYRLAEAAGLYVDPDTKNQMPKDSIPLSDVFATVVRKEVSDAVTLQTQTALQSTKPLSDSLGPLLDQFSRVVAYKRQFNDAFTLDDASQIDKDYYGNKGNVFSMLDVMGLTYNKEFTADSVTVSDVLSVVMAWKRAFADSVSFADSQSFEIAKQLNDTLVLEDAALIDKDYYGYKGDGVGFTDTQSGQFSKGAADTFAFSDTNWSATGKGLTDTVGFSDIANISKVSGRLLNGTSLNVATIN
jgi:uncharacterized lipoprotein NlpE involved in copper resistance